MQKTTSQVFINSDGGNYELMKCLEMKTFTAKVSEKLWLFNHKRADFWLPNFGFKRSLLSLLKEA